MLIKKVKEKFTSHNLPLIISIFALLISAFGTLYSLNRDLVSDQLKAAHHEVELNHKINSSVQFLKCMEETLKYENKFFDEEFYEDSGYVNSVREDQELIQFIMSSSRERVDEMRSEQLIFKHNYKVRMNQALVDMAKKYSKNEFTNAKFICGPHIQ